MVRGILESAGIEAVVRGEVLFSARGEVPITPETAPSVWIVAKSRYDEARRIIRTYELAKNDKLSVGSTWLCPSCGENHEGQFTHCWQCGIARQLPPVGNELS